MKGIEIVEKDIAASFQQAVIDVLVDKTITAAQRCSVDTIVLAGGVAANSGLRELLGKRAEENSFNLMVPPISLCTDNAAMIGIVGYFKLNERKYGNLFDQSKSRLHTNKSQEACEEEEEGED